MPKPNWKDLKLVDGIGNGAGSIIYRVINTTNSKLFACKHVTRKSIEHIERARLAQENDFAKTKVPGAVYQSFFQQVKNEYVVLKEFQQMGGSPHMVKVYELRTVRSAFRLQGYDLLMEFVEGAGLKEDNDYTMSELLEFFRQAAQGLVDLHRLEIVHADLKPAHFMVTPQGLVKIIDFGQSAHVADHAPRIQGTPEYMSPEQLKGLPIDFRTDVYGFGASMYWAFTGKLNRPALTGAAGAGGMDFTVSYAGRSRSVRDDNPDVPKELDNLIIACCERRQEKRPQTMREVWAVITDLIKTKVVPEGV